MAQFAVAKPCEGCGSLLTYAGNENDANLSATCFVCGKTYTLKNPDYTGPKVCSECGQPATLVAPSQGLTSNQKDAIENKTEQEAYIRDLETKGGFEHQQSPAVVVGEKPVDNPVLPEGKSGE